MPNLTTVHLFAGADNGIWTLPPPIVTARRALDRLGEASQALAAPVDPRDVQQRLAEATVTAAAEGKPLPDTGPLVDAEDAHRRFAAAQLVVLDAMGRAGHRLENALAEHAVETIVEHLRPVHDRIVTELAGVADLIVGVESAGDVARAPERVRKAWLRVDDLVMRYVEVRGARADLAHHGARPDLDVTGAHGALRNVDDVWPERGQYALGRSSTPPWPTSSPREALLAQLRLGAELWMPTPAEQDARWSETDGVKVAEQNLRRFELQGFAAAAGA